MLMPTEVDTGTDGESASAPAPSFAALFAEHSGRVWRALRRLGVREADVEDLCQEVFMVIHRKLPGFRGDASLTTWIYGICLRAASDHRRRAHVRREALGEVPEGVLEAPQEETAARREAIAELDRLLGELDEDKRAVFVLFDLEELPMAEVARIVGCPVQTAYYRLYAARREIEAKIAALGAREGGS